MRVAKNSPSVYVQYMYCQKLIKVSNIISFGCAKTAKLYESAALKILLGTATGKFYNFNCEIKCVTK